MTLTIDSLESERLVLEVRKERHASELYDLFCEPDLYHYIGRNIPSSCEELARGFKRLEAQKSPDGQELWLGRVAREKSSRAPVGVFEISIVGEEAFVAYTIFKHYWGKGLAVEGARALIQDIEKKYAPKRFIIEMDTRNRASVKVAEKLGFDFVKVINNAAFIKNFVSHEFQFQKLAK